MMTVPMVEDRFLLHLEPNHHVGDDLDSGQIDQNHANDDRIRGDDRGNRDHGDGHDGHMHRMGCPNERTRCTGRKRCGLKYHLGLSMM